MHAKSPALLTECRAFVHLIHPKPPGRSLPRKTVRGISRRETGQAAGPPHCGAPCSHPANFICRGPARNRRVLGGKKHCRHRLRGRTSGWPAAPRRALFAPGKYYLPGPCSQTPCPWRQKALPPSLARPDKRLARRTAAGLVHTRQILFAGALLTTAALAARDEARRFTT